MAPVWIGVADKTVASLKPFSVHLPAFDADGDVLTFAVVTPPAMSLGKPVVLDELALTGLADESAKEEKARQFNCPNCGAPLDLDLAGAVELEAITQALLMTSSDHAEFHAFVDRRLSLDQVRLTLAPESE